MSLANVSPFIPLNIMYQWRNFSFFENKFLAENDADAEKTKIFKVFFPSYSDGNRRIQISQRFVPQQGIFLLAITKGLSESFPKVGMS